MHRSPRTPTPVTATTPITPTDAGHQATQPRVLLMDPYQQPREVTGRLLAEAGCELAAVTGNYAQAIVAARTHGATLTVVVTDWQPGVPMTQPST